MEENGVLEAIVSRIEVLPNVKQRKSLVLWMKELRANGRADATLKLYASHLEVFGRTVPKAFEDLSRKEVVDYLGAIENKGTRNSNGIVLKVFLKWLHKGTVPECIAWWKPSRVDLELDAEDILTEAEIQTLVAHAGTLRDKALISVLYDSGARISSILSLRRMDITFDEYGGVITLRADKTGKRRIRIVNSVPVMKDLLNGLPDKRPDAGIWFTHIGTPLGYQGAALAVKAAGKRARIKKSVRPHMLRHARATQLARCHVSEFAAKAQLGWKANSGMWARYTHLTGVDVDRELLKASGVKMKEEHEEFLLKPVKCSICGADNDPSYSFCSTCSASLIPEKEVDMGEVVDRLVDNVWRYAEVTGNMALTPEQRETELHQLKGLLSLMAKKVEPWPEKPIPKPKGRVRSKAGS